MKSLVIYVGFIYSGYYQNFAGGIATGFTEFQQIVVCRQQPDGFLRHRWFYVGVLIGLKRSCKNES